MRVMVMICILSSCHGPFWGRGSRRDYRHGRGHYHILDSSFCNKYDGQERLDCQDKQTKWLDGHLK
jgi:hypothetical protein